MVYAAPRPKTSCALIDLCSVGGHDALVQFGDDFHQHSPEFAFVRHLFLYGSAIVGVFYQPVNCLLRIAKIIFEAIRTMKLLAP